MRNIFLFSSCVSFLSRIHRRTFVVLKLYSYLCTTFHRALPSLPAANFTTTEPMYGCSWWWWMLMAVIQTFRTVCVSVQVVHLRSDIAFKIPRRVAHGY
ncbi:hypothetical protein EV363DRAFT_1318093, partial [Boletus edulis]